MHWIALQPSSPTEAATELTTLGWRALQFTPRVALADGALLMEISASERLFGGRRALLTRFFASDAFDFAVEWAQGATSLVALGRLHERRAEPLQASERPLGGQPGAAGALGQYERRQGGPAPGGTPPSQLPLAALAAARPHLPTLERLGCRTWGALRALPRGGLVRRFGDGLLDALDRAFGVRPEVYPWLTLPEVFDQPLELLAHVETAPADRKSVV